MKLFVRHLTNEQLNYCAADLSGSVMHHEADGAVKVNERVFNPCESWENCGPLLTHLLVNEFSINRAIFSSSFKAIRTIGDRVECSFGPTAQIAIVRAYVTLKRGPEAEVTDDLVKTFEMAQA